MNARALVFTLALVACGSSSSGPNKPDDLSADPKNPDGGSSTMTDPDSGTITTPPDPTSRFVDTCNLQASACTAAPAGFAEGKGLAEIDRCAFALEESADITATSDVLTKLGTITGPVSVTDVLNDANRIATKTVTVPGNPSGVQFALSWQDDDNNSVAWTPQGITGSADASETGKIGAQSAVVVAFYDEPVAGSGEENVGVRLAFIDTTTAVAPKYRFVLLVQPTGTKDAPSFAPIKIHAGGIAWYRDYLYVADTTHGLRVFDMRHLLNVATDPGNFGCTASTCRAGTYKYVLPQIGAYTIKTACTSIFSWVSLDRKSDPPSLITGEYCSADACAGPLAGRVFRWPLDKATGLLRSKETFPTEAFLMGQKQVQGGAAVNGVFYLSSSAPSGDGGAIYRVAKGKSATSQWGNNPEDLMVDPGNGWLWNLNEKAGSRSVYAVKLDAYPPPL